MRSPTISDFRIGWLIAAIGILFWTAIGSNIIRTAFERDFLNLYTGGLLARTGHFSKLYDFQLQSATQDKLVPNLPLHFPFVRPPFYAALLAPVSLLPGRIAFPVWIAGMTLGMFVVWWWAWRRFGPDAMVYCAFFLPACLGIAHGQDCIIPMLLLLGAWLLLEQKRDGPAGLLLALCLFKWHLFLLLPLAILFRRRWRLLGGFCAGASLLGLSSVLLAGLAGVRDYFHLLTRDDLATLSPSPEMMVGLNAIAVNLGLHILWFQAILVAALISLVVWTARRSGSDFRWFWTAVLASMALSPHTYEYDLSAVLIPALVAIFEAGDPKLRIAAAILVSPLPYFCTVAGVPYAIAPSLVLVAFLVMLSGVAIPQFRQPELARLPSTH